MEAPPDGDRGNARKRLPPTRKATAVSRKGTWGGRKREWEWEWERERKRKRAVRIAHRQQVCRDGGPGRCALRGSACGHVHQLGPRRGRGPRLRYSRPRKLRRQLQLSALHATSFWVQPAASGPLAWQVARDPGCCNQVLALKEKRAMFDGRTKSHFAAISRLAASRTVSIWMQEKQVLQRDGMRVCQH